MTSLIMHRRLDFANSIGENGDMSNHPSSTINNHVKSILLWEGKNRGVVTGVCQQPVRHQLQEVSWQSEVSELVLTPKRVLCDDKATERSNFSMSPRQI